MKESVLEKDSLILLILSEKKSNQVVGKNLSESREKESTVSGTECNAERKSYHSFCKSRAFSLIRFLS